MQEQPKAAHRRSGSMPMSGLLKSRNTIWIRSWKPRPNRRRHAGANGGLPRPSRHRHHISPSEVNYRANIYGLKMLGVEKGISISACALCGRLRPGHMSTDNLFDFTRGRVCEPFSRRSGAHVGSPDTILRRSVYQLSMQCSRPRFGPSRRHIHHHRRPRSHQSESNTFRSWGMAIIGMTDSPKPFWPVKPN
jgi:5'-methylthioadenosine phosphorylase